MRQPRPNAYRRAASHSARVRLPNWLLPAVALVVLAGLAGTMALSRLIAPGVDVNIAGSRIVDGQLVIADPVLNGFTADDRAYRVSADSATQTIGQSAVALEAISANVELDDERTAVLRADRGSFDPEANTLIISDAGSLEVSDGTRAVFSDVHIDLADGSLFTDRTVTVTRPGAEIIADRMFVEDNGRRLVFEIDVSVVLQPGIVAPATVAADQ